MNQPDKTELILQRFDRRVRDEVRSLVDDELIAEHARDPFGRHSDALERVLNHLRRSSLEGKYVIVCTRPYEEWGIAELSGVRGELPALVGEERFASIAEAEHAVFRLRVERLRGASPEPVQAARKPIVRKPGIVGYADRISVAPGETISFMVSSERAEPYRADIVRLVNGDGHLGGPGFKEEPVETAANREYPGRYQPARCGSYVVVDGSGDALDPSDGLTLHALVWPTTPGKGWQGILTKWSEAGGAGCALGIDAEGRPALRLGDGRGGVDEVRGARPLLRSTWYSVTATYDAAAGRAAVHQAPVVNAVNSLVGRAVAGAAPELVEREVGCRPASADVPFVMAAHVERVESGRPIAGAHYNGKLERPRVWSRPLGRAELDALARGEEPSPAALVAAWDFADGIGADGIPTDRVGETSGRSLHGRCVNMPARAMTGHSWTSREYDCSHAPEQYGAIHFHDDDLEDAGWEADFELTVPEALGSGVYAARLRSGDAEDRVPFCIRPRRGAPAARIVLLLPTASYMAYANERQGTDAALAQLVLAHTLVLQEQDLLLSQHREFGSSLYDCHSDGSGTCYSSRLRPILNMRPRYPSPIASAPWGLDADLHLVDWLHAMGYEFDVVTDEDLHHEGLDLVRPYRVVLTGSHPEYYSGRMLDALEAYVEAGGRLMYLGGNGFYWVTSYHPDKPHLIEVRRGEGGTRAWQARPGEYHHSTTGERGGLWRNRGRAPQKLVGVGFATEGLDRSSHFRRLPDSYDPRAGFIFEGVEDELIGDFGLIGGGAAGLELDRYDLSLGTPPDALLLAASEGLTDQYLLVSEEVPITMNGLGGTQHPLVRGDIVYFTTPGGGAVFSASSIAWCASLSHGGYDNNVSRITGNVLTQFAKDGPPPSG